MNTILEIRAIHKSFAMKLGGGIRSGWDRKEVLKGLSLKLQQGKVTSLVGGNGQGKTSLFNLISGFIRPDAGEIIYRTPALSMDCTRETPFRIANAGVGRMFQGSRVFPHLSVLDNLRLHYATNQMDAPFYRIRKFGHFKKEQKLIREHIIEMLDKHEAFNELKKEVDHRSSSLSFAQQRLLSLAGLMLGEYQVLLLDEPSSGLNPSAYDGMFSLINGMRSDGKTVFLIEHNMEFVRNLADVCHFLSDGVLTLSGSAAEVLEHRDVKESYLR